MEKPKLKEHDGMQCRYCGNEERASEGYPCADCGTFICLICSFRGINRCKACEETAKAQHAAQPRPPPRRPQPPQRDPLGHGGPLFQIARAPRYLPGEPLFELPAIDLELP